MMVATDPSETAASGGSAESDADALRAWRAACPELRALWDEREPVTAWEWLGFGEAGGADAGRVVEVSISLRGLSGDVPAAVGGLTALKTLRLDGNKLTSVPAALGGLTALTGLFLGGNQLTSVPAELGELTALERLKLGGNRLTRVGSVPEELGGLTALTELDLSGNQPTCVPAALGVGRCETKAIDTRVVIAWFQRALFLSQNMTNCYQLLPSNSTCGTTSRG